MSEIYKSYIEAGENLNTEFKLLSEGIIEENVFVACIALANTKGGNVYLGISDKGRYIGVGNELDITRISGIIRRKTFPPLNIEVDEFVEKNARIIVLKIPSPKEGQLPYCDEKHMSYTRVMRRGRDPENVVLSPSEILQMGAARGIVDFSATPVKDVSYRLLQETERNNLRRHISENPSADKRILRSSNAKEFDIGLGLAKPIGNKVYPTIAGILFLGTPRMIRDTVQTNEVIFQVQDRDNNSPINEVLSGPLIPIFNQVEALFKAQQKTVSVDIGILKKVKVPNCDEAAFREAFVNALIHRDYRTDGAVYVVFNEEELKISSPGGFVNGVNARNIFRTEPKPRNRTLADIARTIGWAERSGKGVRTIFEQQLRAGRPIPYYQDSLESSVSIVMSISEIDIEFLKIIIKEEDDRQERFDLKSLMLLSSIRAYQGISGHQLSLDNNYTVYETNRALDKLLEAGIIEARGSARKRSFFLSTRTYRNAGMEKELAYRAAYSSNEDQALIMKYAIAKGSVSRSDVLSLCKVDKDNAYRLLKKLVLEGQLTMVGSRRGAHYVCKQ